MTDEPQAEYAEASSLTYTVQPLVKTDSATNVMVSNAFLPEDEFRNFYIGATGGSTVQAIRPPYNLVTLERLSQENNALGPCIECMVTNVDGTGYDVVKDAPGAEEPDGMDKDAKVIELEEFLAEPWPGESFQAQRKSLRRDIKRTGNGYLEIIRNAKDDIMFTRQVAAKMIRLIKLQEEVNAQVVVKRQGQDVKVTLKRRYRRFVQVVNGTNLVYFKEFGCPIDLDKTTGQWAEAGKRVPAAKRATEMIHFLDLPDANTPYGVPAWIGQLPSVLGSRKAEEFNGEFFDNGGVPPVLIILQGGVLSSESRKAIEQRVAGPAAKKQRVNVIEMEASGGTIDSPSNAKVVVERFGAERQQDSMFEKYDDKCEIRVRRAFRLPPIFFGHVEGHNYATAYASYTVAEAQVFKPERDAFDEIISIKLIPALGYKGYLLKSRPLTIEDATLKLQGLTLAAGTQQVDAEEMLDAVNETVGTSLKVSKTLPIPSLLPAPSPTPGSSRASTGGKSNTKITQEGKAQQNKGTAKAKPIPRRSPAVQKEEVGEDEDVMRAALVKALDAYDNGDMEEVEDALDEFAPALLAAE